MSDKFTTWWDRVKDVVTIYKYELAEAAWNHQQDKINRLTAELAEVKAQLAKYEGAVEVEAVMGFYNHGVNGVDG